MASTEPPRTHYVHRISFSLQERLVGAFVIIALAVALAVLLARGETSDWFQKQVMFSAYLSNAQGISTESAVRVSGIRVGRVTAIGLSPDNRIHIRFYVLERFRNLVRADSRAALSKLSFVGNAAIEIGAGSPTAPLLAEGAVLAVEEPMSIDELIADIKPVVEKAGEAIERVADLVQAIDPAAVHGTTNDLARTAANLRAASEQVVAGRGALGRVFYDERLAERIDGSVAALQATLEQAHARLAQLQPVLSGARGVTGESKEFARRLNELAVQTRGVVTQVDNLLVSLDTELQQFPDLVRRLRLLVESADRTLEGVQRVWPLSSAVPPPNSNLTIEAAPVHE